jgi:hypothetical protein
VKGSGCKIIHDDNRKLGFGIEGCGREAAEDGVKVTSRINLGLK